LYQFIVTHPTHGLGGESNFEFKYVPQFDTTTTTSRDAQDVESTLKRLRKGGVEWRNLKALLISAGVLITSSFVGIKVSLATYRAMMSLV
jgi:hypothetical protein